MALLDTHSIVEELITVGFDKKQAEAITKINVATHNKLATKHDVDLVRKDIDLVRKDVDHVRRDLEMVEKSLRSEIGSLKWMVGLGMAIIVMMLSLLLSKLL